jgi:predicted Zn-dependent protease
MEAMTRREFLVLSGAAVASLATGCATNPVTGESQFMLFTEANEREWDRLHAPHQFSADYGVFPDPALNAYVADVGARLAAISHRPHMPYSFRVLNAVHVNAYTFPAGSIGVTRGILLSMESESELAALLGHEIAHVNYRHAASRMSQALAAQLVVGLGVMAIAAKKEKYAALAAGLGALGSGLLLAKYSRDDERQADQGGHAYLVTAGYHPDGMGDLMERLVALQEREPTLLEIMFASHPMSRERLDTARQRALGEYAAMRDRPPLREAYMDRTASVRAQRDAILAMQKALRAFDEGRVEEADVFLAEARRRAPSDYAALVLSAKLKLAQNRFQEALALALAARQALPGEAQAIHLCGMARLKQGQYDAAWQEFEQYDQTLPGNPEMAFWKGYALEQMQRLQPAAQEYLRYLQSGAEGEQAQYAYQRLVQWGVITPEKTSPATGSEGGAKPSPAKPKSSQKKPTKKK